MALNHAGSGTGILTTVEERGDGASSPDPHSSGYSDKPARPPTVPSQTSPTHRVDATAGGGVVLEAAAAEVTPSTRFENQPFCGSTCIDGSTVAGDGLLPSVPRVRGAHVNVGFSGESHSGIKEEGRPQTTSTPSVARVDPVSPLVDSSDWCDRGVEVCEVPDGEDDVTSVDNTTACETMGEECEAAGLGLTDADLMHAAEVLMSSSPLDDELKEETDTGL